MSASQTPAQAKRPSRMQERDVELLYEVGCLRHVPRVWRQFGGPNVANVAEHTLRVAWITQVLATQEGADVARAVQLALVHDLGKSRAGDAHWLNRAFTQRNQAGAVAATVAGTSVEASNTALFQEFVDGQTAEANIVKDADNLDADLEFAEQRANWSFAEAERSVRESVFASKLHTESARRLWRQILKSRPDSWYVNEYEAMRQGGTIGAAEPTSPRQR